MNKKVFTLLAASLSLFMTVFTANAQTRSYCDTVKYLPEGMGGGAYHLLVTVGTKPTKQFLVMDNYGYISMMDSAKIYGGTEPDSIYRRLRSSLWCVNVDKPETYGKVPGFSFTNKEYGAEMAFSYVEGLFDHKGYSEIPVMVDGKAQHIVGEKDLPLVGGEKSIWKFSRTYNTVPLETEQYLAIEVKPDYYMTFASRSGSLDPDSIRLVIAHKDEFQKTTDFYQKELLRFTLVTAMPRVLYAKDFNTMLYEHSKEDYRTMSFSTEVTKGQFNPFTQPLMAEDVPGTTGNSHYLYLKSQKESGKYVVMLDGDKESNYNNVLGYRYPKVENGNKITTGGQDEWRLVYYPSEDSVVINVREIKHIDNGHFEDNGTYLSGDYDKLYNQEIWNYLTVRMQDLSSDRVVTVANTPGNVRGFFNVASCVIYDTDRTTVPTDLYTVRDKDGRYLVVPLYAGDFTPQWLFLDEGEVANMTPSSQWFVKQVNSASGISKVHLINREFEDIQIEYVQLYNSYHLFNGVWTRLNPKNPKDYSPVVGKNLVNKESFVRVPKPYRNDPYLGYRFFSQKKAKKEYAEAVQEAADSLNWFSFSFKYLTDFYENAYMGYKEDAKDTILYALKGEKTYFRLVPSDELRTATTPVASYKTEKYGIGHTDGLLTGSFAKEGSADYIAPLCRWYYNFQINDYWKFKRNHNYVVLDDNGRYGFTKETNANSRPLKKAQFYLRFTYQKDGVDYYTLLDRIKSSNFHYLTDILDWSITDTMRAYDNSHGKYVERSYGVVQAAVNDYNPWYIRAQPKTYGAERLSTFALSCDTEPLYRRFNTLDESSQANDDPDTLKFFVSDDPKYFIYEDAHSTYSNRIKPLPKLNYSSINFMGVQNVDDAIKNQNKDQIFKRHLDTDWAIYVDTAYVNRGTGHIKPQYLLVVDPQWGPVGCPKCDEYHPLNKNYLYGRFLRNMTDSAREGGAPNGPIRDEDYIWDSTWERLAFVPAIHLEDSLYILNGTKIDDFLEIGPDNKPYLNHKLLNKAVIDKKVVKRMLDNNKHKDEVFSFRYIEKGGGVKKNFLIESETTNRTGNGPMIAPLEGGWIKWQNYVPVISRGSFDDWIEEAEVWNVEMTDKAPLANNEVSTTDVVVVPGVASVNVLNASGKQVTVSNILGQTIARVVLTSDNETIEAPKGIVVVAIEGENAVKAVVK